MGLPEPRSRVPVTPDRLRTARTIVRPHALGDAAQLSQAVTASQAHLHRWVPSQQRSATVQGAEDTIRAEQVRWDVGQAYTMGIFDPDDSTVMGGIGFHPRGGPHARHTTEVGMWVHVDHAGRGVGTEVLRDLVAWAFADWWWQRVEWHCDGRNLPSAAVANRAGLRHEQTMGTTMVFAAHRPRS